MRQIDTDAIKNLIRRNYAAADVWLGDLQVVKNGVWLGAEGEALLEAKVRKHIKWVRKHPARAEEVLV